MAGHVLRTRTSRPDSSTGICDRGAAQVLSDATEKQVRETKSAIDGKYGFRKPENRGVRSLFHLPLNRPFAPVMFE
ncbi:MAG: hypothetical protein KY445_10260 [Armatimonadetes bacterium]|nr:hypothetical protein [Armatimonadota bacterium]